MAVVKLSCVNVGYGDAFFFEGAEGNCLMDTGSGMAQEYEGYPERIDILRFLKNKEIKHIDHLILSHIHDDHVGNLVKLLKEFSVNKIWIPKGFGEIKDIEIFGDHPNFRKKSSELFFRALRVFASALDFCAKRGIEVEELCEGEHKRLSGLELKVLGAAPERTETFLRYYRSLSECKDPAAAEELVEKMDAFSNHTSLLLKIGYKSFRGLFCADNVPGNWSKQIGEELEDVNFIKLPHHGQRDAIDTERMRRMPLLYCLTTSSSERRYNSANPEIYKNLSDWAREDKRDLKILFTDPSEEYRDLKEVEYGNTSIVFEIDENICYQYKNQK
ncbi:MAG: MBL fold metallo-hydrolase [Johnsonella sp.]|nr:MBL fold metallo-hydrolase [Johnsonella sp.]